MTYTLYSTANGTRTRKTVNLPYIKALCGYDTKIVHELMQGRELHLKSGQYKLKNIDNTVDKTSTLINHRIA